MKPITLLGRVCAVFGVTLLLPTHALAQSQIPAELKDWQDWATWDAKHRNCPTPFNDASKPRLFLAGQTVALGGPEIRDVGIGASRSSARPGCRCPAAATPGRWMCAWTARPRPWSSMTDSPASNSLPGQRTISGAFRWEGEMPQLVRVPREVGVLSLSLEGRKVEIPNWDDTGNLWLKRVRVEATDKDAVTAQVWRRPRRRHSALAAHGNRVERLRARAGRKSWATSCLKAGASLRWRRPCPWPWTTRAA